MSDGVTTRRDGHILEVTLERGKVNAIDVPTSQALAEAFKELHQRMHRWSQGRAWSS